MTALHTVCVFAGANDGLDKRHGEVARSLGACLAKRGIRLVYGGAAIGLMGAVAHGALQAGGEVVGVIPDYLVQEEVALRDVTELRIVASIQERKSTMSELSDAFIVLPGGLGTLEEFFEIATSSLLGLHVKPVAMLNFDDYFDLLLRFVDHAFEQGLILRPRDTWLLHDNEVERLVQRLVDEERDDGAPTSVQRESVV